MTQTPSKQSSNEAASTFLDVSVSLAVSFIVRFWHISMRTAGGNSLSLIMTLLTILSPDNLRFSFFKCYLVAEIEFFLRLFMYSLRISRIDFTETLSGYSFLYILPKRTSSDYCFSILSGRSPGDFPPLSMKSLL